MVHDHMAACFGNKTTSSFRAINLWTFSSVRLIRTSNSLNSMREIENRVVFSYKWDIDFINLWWFIKWYNIDIDIIWVNVWWYSNNSISFLFIGENCRRYFETVVYPIYRTQTTSIAATDLEFGSYNINSFRHVWRLLCMQCFSKMLAAYHRFLTAYCAQNYATILIDLWISSKHSQISQILMCVRSEVSFALRIWTWSIMITDHTTQCLIIRFPSWSKSFYFSKDRLYLAIVSSNLNRLLDCASSFLRKCDYYQIYHIYLSQNIYHWSLENLFKVQYCSLH